MRCEAGNDSSRENAQSLTAVTTVSESDFFHTTDSVTVDMDFVKRYLSLLLCLAGNVYSLSSAHYETFAESTSSCKTVVKIKVEWGEMFAVTVRKKIFN